MPVLGVAPAQWRVVAEVGADDPPLAPSDRLQRYVFADRDRRVAKLAALAPELRRHGDRRTRHSWHEPLADPWIRWRRSRRRLGDLETLEGCAADDERLRVTPECVEQASDVVRPVRIIIVERAQ